MQVKKLLEEHYSGYDEDERLVKDKAHQVEFITTTKYIDKYLKDKSRILEIGAGTGRYSIHYAKKGYEVDSVDLVQSNLDVLKKKITSDMKINVRQGNALDLSCYEDNTFDVTLCLGPLYHLFSKEDKEKAISEAIRVTKSKGIIYFAFITNEAVIISYGLRKGNLLRLTEIIDENYKVKDIQEEIFSANYVKEFEEMVQKNEVRKLHTVAADGISADLAQYVNELTEEEYKIWIDYHLATCEREDLIGYSSHVLYICEKD